VNHLPGGATLQDMALGGFGEAGFEGVGFGLGFAVGQGPAATTFAGLPLLVAPGVVSTVRLPWEGGPVVDHDQPPMLAFHVLDDDGRLTTHVRAVTG